MFIISHKSKKIQSLSRGPIRVVCAHFIFIDFSLFRIKSSERRRSGTTCGSSTLYCVSVHSSHTRENNHNNFLSPFYHYGTSVLPSPNTRVSVRVDCTYVFMTLSWIVLKKKKQKYVLIFVRATGERTRGRVTAPGRKTDRAQWSEPENALSKDERVACLLLPEPSPSCTCVRIIHKRDRLFRPFFATVRMATIDLRTYHM